MVGTTLPYDKEKYVTKTGTTIAAVKYKSGIVFAADTRSTSGPIVSNKFAFKIHKISDKIYCCGAGTAADTRRVTSMAARKLSIFSYTYHRDPSMSHCERIIADHLHNYGGYIGAHLILGGMDESGFQLSMISNDGFTSKRSFCSMGSGSMAANGVLFAGYKVDMEKEEAINLATNAIKAGILNDLYSGTQVDIVVIDTMDGVNVERDHLTVAAKPDVEPLSVKTEIEITKDELFKYVEITE